ncbi:hypothetical protein A6X21_02140 [Planctopirus hydrillae]|uniref:Uncharacterized protein n=1 Tax=Planctopirus hydrillae TaxID=1841610 RepID=A0A1C3ETK2_9PLAN|nr:hypothetical protein A6X21_02140 [Planctopirus hydrillae]
MTFRHWQMAFATNVSFSPQSPVAKFPQWHLWDSYSTRQFHEMLYVEIMATGVSFPVVFWQQEQGESI